MVVVDALYLRETIRLTAGRIAWVARAILSKLRPDERPAIEKIATETAEIGQRAYETGVVREKASLGLFSPLAREKNTELDHVTSGIFTQLDSLARIHVAGTEMGDRVRSLLAELYPQSLPAVTTGAFADELEAARRVVRIAREKRQADVAAVPGLSALIDLLDERATAFESVLEREQATGPSFADAAAAAEEAERRMADLVMAIQVLYRGDGAEAATRRSELLEPYVIQQESVRRRRKRRQRPVDVDPETGEELTAPTDEPAEAAAAPKKPAVEPT